MHKRLTFFLAVVLALTLVADPLTLGGLAAGLPARPLAPEVSALYTQNALMIDGVGRFPSRPLSIAALIFLISLVHPAAAQQSTAVPHEPSGTTTVVPIPDPLKPYRDLADHLLNTAGLNQQQINQAYSARTWTGRPLLLNPVLSDANNTADHQNLSRGLAYLRRWNTALYNQLAAERVTIILSPQVPIPRVVYGQDAQGDYRILLMNPQELQRAETPYGALKDQPFAALYALVGELTRTFSITAVSAADKSARGKTEAAVFRARGEFLRRYLQTREDRDPLLIQLLNSDLFIADQLDRHVGVSPVGDVTPATLLAAREPLDVVMGMIEHHYGAGQMLDYVHSEKDGKNYHFIFRSAEGRSLYVTLELRQSKRGPYWQIIPSIMRDGTDTLSDKNLSSVPFGMSLGGLGILNWLARTPMQGPLSSWSDAIAWWQNTELTALDWLMIAIVGGAFVFTLFEILTTRVGHRNHNSAEHVQGPLDPLEQQARYYASHDGALARSVKLKKNKQLVIETDPQGRLVVRQRASRRWLRPRVWAPYIPSLFLAGLDIYILKQPSFQEQLFDLNFASFFGLALGVIGLDIGAYFFVQWLGKKLFSAYFRWDWLSYQRKEIRRLKKWLGLDWRRDLSDWASSTRPLLLSTSRAALGVAVFLVTVALPANGSSAPKVPPLPSVLEQAA